MKISLLFTLEKTINAYIHLDTNCQKKLKKLAGRVFGVEVAGLNLTMYFVFLEKEIKLQSDCISEPDVFIKSPPFSLLRIFSSSEPNEIFYEDQIDVKGDMTFAQAVKQFFDTIDIDWAGYLSYITGDVIAQQTQNFITNNKKRLKNFSSSLTQNTNEYLQEELKAFPPKEEVEDFYSDVANLRDCVERLGLRVKQLDKKMRNC